MSPAEHQELCERIAALEARREAESDERDTRRQYLDGELAKIFKAVTDSSEWVRIQLFGNGKKEGCIDYRLKKVEAFTEGWDWRKAAFTRFLTAVLQAVIIAGILVALNWKR